MGLEASINEDAFDLDELTEDENDDVVDPTAAALGTDASVYHSSVPEVVFYSSNLCDFSTAILILPILSSIFQRKISQNCRLMCKGQSFEPSDVSGI